MYRRISYQRMNGKWYQIDVVDLIDPLDENSNLRKKVAELQIKLEKAELNKKSG